MFFRVICSFFAQRFRAAHRQSTATITTFPGLAAFRAYVEGRITLEEFRKADTRIIVKRIE